MRAGLYDRRAKRHVPVDRMLLAVGISAVSPEPTPDVAAFLAAEAALKQVR